MMESLDRSRAVIELGKRLVTELGLGDDLLAQWLAHVIAERMDEAERAAPEARGMAQDACRDAIFSLWEHRNILPFHMRPFRELEPLVRTLASLDPDSGTRFRYIPRPPSDEELEGTEVAGKRFLEAAVNLDYAARALIQYLLRTAAKGAAEQATPWLVAAVDAKADVEFELRIVDFVSGSEQDSGADEIARKALLDKIERLESFSQMALDVAAEFRSQLAPSAGSESDRGT